MSTLIDQDARDRFIRERGKNISVIAPAGVGKTRSMIERIVHIASQPDAETVLPRLIVVTYSVRAAQQMQQKARVAIRDANLNINVQRAFQQAFFGTIHSYCVRLLERFGHYIGLPSSVELLLADDDLWSRFLLRGLGQGLSRNHLRDLFHFYAPEKLYALGREISPGKVDEIGPLPHLNLQPVFDYRDAALHSATQKSIARAQAALKNWGDSWARGERFRPLPKPPESEKALAFAIIWNEAFAPLHEWLRHAALAFGRNVANDYAKFRKLEAVMTYDDQIRMALSVLDLPAVQTELAAERLSVLLDEAQDTDPNQFKVLLRVAGFSDASIQADDQTFCMVGDFQQSIYAPRSDLTVYRKAHEDIIIEPRGTSSELQVTFRCDRAIIDFVNRLFPSVLNDVDGQSRFITLSPRDDAGPGQVVRWTCPDDLEPSENGKISADMRARHEARFLAQRIHDLGPTGLGASDWSQVAILCPRKTWLLDIQRELLALNVPVQLHSSNEQQGARTASAWLISLIWVAAYPEDSFEIVGVLREILGVSDHDIATYTNTDGDRLRLDRPASDRPQDNPVESALQILRNAFDKINEMPLLQAVQQIVEKTQLRERMNSVTEIREENPDRELDDLLAVVAARSAKGTTLVELAQEIRLGFTQGYPAEEEIRDAIQMMTSHKSKGLEWQTVILPFTFRNIESKSTAYPRLVQGAGGQETVYRDKIDYEAGAHEFVTKRDRQQLQRLLYVMCTRAKQTLLMIDDESLFAEKRTRGGWSAGELLDLENEGQQAIWKGLPEILTSASATPSKASNGRTALIPLPKLSKADLKNAQHRAGDFPRRVTPHALAIHVDRDSESEENQEREEETPSPENPGILYGTWWHDFVETIPWSQPAESWQKKFETALLESPQPERSMREWQLLRDSKLARWLGQPGQLIQVELPFLWRDGADQCVEGIIDLAVYEKEKSTWHVIDWKTNRLGPQGEKGVVDIYREQLRAYVKALRELLKTEVRGSLYLTQSGEWLDVETLKLPVSV
jgi:ATP-dependent exoDNAse (exonuclease V) beta subunit